MTCNQTKNKHIEILDITDSIIRSPQNGASVIIPHICNNQNVFVGGLSKIIADKYPKVKANFEVVGKQNLGKTQFITADRGVGDQYLYIANMIAQDNSLIKRYNRKIRYTALIQCIYSLKSFIDKLHQYSQPKSLQIHIAEFDFPCHKNEFRVITNIIEDICDSTPLYIY